MNLIIWINFFCINKWWLSSSFSVQRPINEFIHFMQLGKSVLLPLNHVFVRNTNHIKHKQKVQEIVRRNRKKYLSIHRRIVIFCQTSSLCLRRQLASVENWWCSTTTSLLSIFCLQVNASQKLCQLLQKPGQKLLSLIQLKFCNHLPSSLTFWGSLFSFHTTHPCTLLWEKAFCLWKANSPKIISWGKSPRKFWGPKGSWSCLFSLCSFLREGDSSANSISRIIALSWSWGHTELKLNQNRIAQQLILQIKFFSQNLPAKCLKIYPAWLYLASSIHSCLDLSFVEGCLLISVNLMGFVTHS